MKFEKFKLSNELLKGLTDLGFKECLPVQSETLVHTLEKKDVCVQSQTGSGKTAVFLITIFQTFVKEKENENKQALIIVPTRELAVQIEKEAKQIAKYLSFNIQSFYGGVGYDKQLKAINKGVNVIIATPGRLLDFASKKLISLADIGIFVVDELLEHSLSITHHDHTNYEVDVSIEEPSYKNPLN